ncbi:hypothetical protein OG912_09950 [Streptomyces sp. NBC_00464]|uniref:hypothetical protein n=1 Tax=Streptomyces sp. NBC_00464 TaxID=2975751 RepID=UPI002E17BA7B
MKRTRAFTCAAAVLVAGLLAGASGCSLTPEDTGAKPKPTGSPTAAQTGAEQVSAPEERACKGGTYTWFNLQSQYVLNGVTDAQLITAKPTKMTEPMRRLRTDQASLESEGPRLDAKAVFYALSVRIGLADKGEDPEDLEGWSGLGEPGAYAPFYDDGDWTGGVGSRLVAFSAVEMVDVDFRYTCKGGRHREPTVGHVSTWGRDLSGALDCEDPLPEGASGAAREAAVREAVRLSCGR